MNKTPGELLIRQSDLDSAVAAGVLPQQTAFALAGTLLHERAMRPSYNTSERGVAAGAFVDPTARLDRTILWDDVTIGAGAALERCVVADRVQVPAGLHVADACLVPWPDGYAAQPAERRAGDLLIVPSSR